jgi:hypothetical protein
MTSAALSHRESSHPSATVPLRALIAAAAIALTLGLALPLYLTGSPRSTLTPTRQAALEAGRQALPAALQGPVSAALGSRDPAYRAAPVAGGFHVANPAQGLDVKFARSGAHLSAGAMQVHLRALAAGYGATLTPLRAVHPTATGNRVTYTRPGLSEWYRNGPLGLEQGFTVSREPAGHASGPFTLSLAMTGNQRVLLARGGQSLTLTRAGERSLRYTALSATDAHGHGLRSWLELRSGRLLLRVDARGATYPLQIDPLIQQVEELPGSSGGKFGFSVALSADGSTALVGAPEQRGGEGEGKKEGVAYVFTRSGSSWTQQGGTPSTNGTFTTLAGFGGGAFGSSVALSGDGNTALIGSPESRAGTGLAWVFTRSGSTWSESERLKDNNSTEHDTTFGAKVALSTDGSTALIGAESPEGKPVDVVFTHSGSSWSAQQRLEGVSGAIALSSNGSTLLIGGSVFIRSGSTWTQQGPQLTGSDQIGESGFGDSVALSAEGNTALIGGPEDNRCVSCARSTVGAAWVFTRSGSTWTQQGEKLTAKGAPVEGHFGESVALSADGNTAVIGAPGNGETEPTEGGSAFVFTRSGSTWTQRQQFTPSGTGWQEELENGAPEFGISVAMSAKGRSVIVGASDFESGWASVFASPAAVSSITPTAGPHSGGTSVTITGSSLSEASAVYFGSNSAASFHVNSESSVTAVAPAGSGTVDVTVTLPEAGPSATSPADQFTYTPRPEIGRCTASAKRAGEYTSAACIKSAHGKGKDNWHAGPGAKAKFTSVLKAPAFETTSSGKVLIACASGKGEGEYTGVHILKMTRLVLSGCAESPPLAGVQSDCQTVGSANGEIVANPLTGEFGSITMTETTGTVGMDLTPASGAALASFECGGASEATGKGTGTGTARELVGSVIGKVTHIDIMGASNVITYEKSAGHQVPERFEGGLPDVLTTLVGLAKAPEPTTFTGTEEVKYEERLEINRVV